MAEVVGGGSWGGKWGGGVCAGGEGQHRSIVQAL